MRGPLVAMMLVCATTHSAATAPFEERIAACLACHGEKGQSANPEVPSLGAQTAPYTLIQLFMFREKLRRNDIMNDAVKGFSDDDLRTFSDYVSKLPSPRPVAEPADAARLQRGQMLVRRHRCDVCHNPDLAGRENVPASPANARIFSPRPCANTKPTCVPATTPRWGTCCSRSPTRRFWISLILRRDSLRAGPLRLVQCPR